MPQTMEEKRRKVEEMKKVSDSLTPKQKLANLDKKLGVGKGAERERKRLNVLIANDKGDIPFGQTK